MNWFWPEGGGSISSGWVQVAARPLQGRWRIKKCRQAKRNYCVKSCASGSLGSCSVILCQATRGWMVCSEPRVEFPNLCLCIRKTRSLCVLTFALCSTQARPASWPDSSELMQWDFSELFSFLWTLLAVYKVIDYFKLEGTHKLVAHISWFPLRHLP